MPICRACNKPKPASEFWPKPGGHSPVCKECSSRASKREAAALALERRRRVEREGL